MTREIIASRKEAIWRVHLTSAQMIVPKLNRNKPASKAACIFACLLGFRLPIALTG
jgi:hypothetical protein